MVIHDKPSQEMGDRGESNFVAACLAKGWVKPEKSNSYQDRLQHWDYKMSNGARVDVKAAKKKNRSDTNPDYSLIYVEFKGITGHAGWIYGKADLIAFEREFDFILIPRLLVVKLAETLVSSEFSRRPELYKSYRRRNRPDERVGLITIEDMLQVKHSKLMKVIV
tara:strand:+ start:117910 stop:118404 length:495 start_codon:yes stop_codon:yes gene_type:complete